MIKTKYLDDDVVRETKNRSRVNQLVDTVNPDACQRRNRAVRSPDSLINKVSGDDLVDVNADKGYHLTYK